MRDTNFNWTDIRSVNGGQDKGFEEFCTQLARREVPADARFQRKGAPDAGVECFATLSDGSEWAWQAKYFTDLDSPQWRQIDESVRTAIEKHPRLVRYYVCIPLDLPDARITGWRSATDRWNQHVEKWIGWAAARSMSVEFVYWGSHALIVRLSRPENVGRRWFWFGKIGFDNKWFSERLEEAIGAAGPRYTPEVHVKLQEIAQNFEALGRTELFVNGIKALAIPLRAGLQRVGFSQLSAVDADFKAAADKFAGLVQRVLDDLRLFEARADGPLLFQPLVVRINDALSAAENLFSLLLAQEQSRDATRSALMSSGVPYISPPRFNSHEGHRFRLHEIIAALRQVAEELQRVEPLAKGNVLLLSGDAGTGKTHLLCDVASKRIAEDRPTILLMGQRFTSGDSPWTQILQHLDLSQISAKEFIGALEAAAQASGKRALLMIDALNEGTGRSIWPAHLAAFLKGVGRSEWMSVVLSVRKSYEERVVPAEVRAQCTRIEHSGFQDHEYDATKTFFAYYGLELPSTPLLAPEFGNPLFLKTLCLGLQGQGQRRLPRGTHGITAVLDLYWTAVNNKLADQLDFDRRLPLVRQALDAMAKAFAATKAHWLTLQDAKEVIDDLLPGRSFEHSLFRALVAEGVLIEDVRLHDDSSQDIVYIAYERFADHLVAKILIDRHWDSADPTAAFRPGGGLEFLGDSNEYVAPGLLEALFIQVPERCGQELVALFPEVGERWESGEAFRQSLVWRADTAFSDGTMDALDSTPCIGADLPQLLDVLLTVATLPEHPLNARFLDRRLRKDSMADRDAWWSTTLHGMWAGRGAVDRLLDWASAVVPETELEDETVQLAGTALAWMLASSNRFLRDRATKALVSLLTGRLDITVWIVSHFSDVDDPYVTERIYAVAYGVAMRSSDTKGVGRLAESVYGQVFDADCPPAHILLRDYARGVVERALHLGSPIMVDAARIRPPYKSQWPGFPTENEIQSLRADWSKGSYDSGGLEWARNRIASSVLDHDFARYVIGTNSRNSGPWLSLTLADPPWEPPRTADELILRLKRDLSEQERLAWDQYEEADDVMNAFHRQFIDDTTAFLDHEDADEAADHEQTPELTAAETIRNARLADVRAVFSADNNDRLSEILAAADAGRVRSEPRRVELADVQRYILKRVFDLGWTIERFGEFDRRSVEHVVHPTHKAERIGKKYQWIAYHEILALLSDRFQYYYEGHGIDEADAAYEGPWQLIARDIDPSCTLRSTPGSASLSSPTAAWWVPARFDSWAEPGHERSWVLRTDDLPKVEQLLVVTDPKDGQCWLNAEADMDWQQKVPAHERRHDVERGDLSYRITGYLIRGHDTEAFLMWAEGTDFARLSMHESVNPHGAFLGEHAWAPASRYFETPYYEDEGRVQPPENCPVRIRTVAVEHMQEQNTSDCSVDEHFALRLPVRDLITKLGLRWSGTGADFVDPQGKLAAQDPTAKAPGPSALLVRADQVDQLRDRNNLTLCWIVVGGKRILGTWVSGAPSPALQMSGAYVLGDSGIKGFVKRTFVDAGERAGECRLVDTYRTG